MNVYWWVWLGVIWTVVSVLWVWYTIPYSFTVSQSPLRYGNDGSILVWENYNPWHDYADIPPRLVEIVVGIEDKRFWKHHGIDGIAMMRALWIMLSTDTVQWWSTITQQLVKLDRGRFERSMWIKMQEMWHAVRIEHQFSKQQILLSYLNSMQRPWNVRGWNAACTYFMGRSCSLLSDTEIMVLMVASQRGWNLYDETDQHRIVTRLQAICPVIDVSCENVTDAVFDSLLWNDTSLDPRVQSMIVQEYATASTDYDQEIAWSIDRILQTTAPYRKQYQATNCCVVVLNDEWNMVSMNQCTQRWDEWWGKTNSCLIPRQTWSVTKPLLYAYGLETLWLDRNDTVVDEYVAYPLWWWAVYEPQNFDLSYHGVVSWAYALGNSLNIPAVKMLEMVWVEDYLTFLRSQLAQSVSWAVSNTQSAQELGLSLALGTYEISPYQMTKLWQFFTTRWQGYDRGKEEVIAILQDPLNKVASFGQDSFLVRPWWAVKTGTSRNFVDGWICGLQSSQAWYSVCMRIGNITNTPMEWSSAEIWWFIRDQILDVLEENQKNY